MKHTPTPWIIRDCVRTRHGGDTGREVLLSGFALTAGNNPRQKEAEANVEYILKAVNYHQELVDALDELMDALDEYNYLSNKTEKAYHKAFNLLKDVKNK